MVEPSIFVFQCQRCFACYVLADSQCAEKYGAVEKRDLILANPCRVCGKGSVEELCSVVYDRWCLSEES